MKVLRTLFATLLVLVIVGGIGYLGYTTIYMGGMNHGSMNPEAGSTASPSSNMANMQNQTTQNQENTSVPNIIAAQNREKMAQAQSLLNQAIDLITIDPYSKATVPQINTAMQSGQMGTAQGAGTINIYPSDNSTVTVMPDNKGTVVNPASTASTGQNMQGGITTNNYVYNQNQLQQLHSDIYSVAQGVMLITQLSDNLSYQSAQSETNPADYQTYVNRYNTALNNKNLLSQAVSKLDSLATIINNNPYATQNGYAVNSGDMDRLHQGVYKLAQAMELIARLNNDFTMQMADASVGAKSLVNGSNLMTNMQMGTSSTINLSTIFNIVLITLVIGLIAGIIGAIVKLAKRNPTEPPKTEV